MFEIPFSKIPQFTHLNLPKKKIKKLIQSNEDIGKVSASIPYIVCKFEYFLFESYFIIAKALEAFL